MTKTAFAFQIAEHIDLKRLKMVFKERPLVSDSDELFYQFEGHKYLYAFKYGIICVFDYSSNELEHLKKKMLPVLKGKKTMGSLVSETLEINTKGDGFSTDFETVTLKELNAENLRLVLLNLSEDTRQHTNYLEHHGKLDIGGKKLKRYIGKVLNVKNKISENLYIFDSPDVALDDEVLNGFNLELKIKFDLKDRYQIISQQVDIIKENLDLFKDIMFHKESSKLEWIIIVLIVIEVIDLFILKIIT
jgi:uncharacterized Rmd1/YagE family protein